MPSARPRAANRAVLAALVTLALAALARADDAREPEAQEATSERQAPPSTWYGWQLGLLDASSYLMIRGATQENHIGYLALATYLFGPPAAHALNGQRQKALLSFTLRLGVPLAAGLVFAGLDGDESFAFIGGALLGGIVVIFFDDVGSAWKRKPGPSAPLTATAWMPTLELRDGGATFGLAGTL